jgi:hypothetical protein
LLKNITALVTPLVTIIPPYNEITITHESRAFAAQNIGKEEMMDGPLLPE